MIRLSVVIITFNEERNILRCLESVKSIADEILVVDSFSTDATKNICESAGVRFVEHRFEGYIEQKNYALDCASHPYILSLDADEALSSGLRQSILDIKSNWTCGCYSMNRMSNYCGKWIRFGGWYPDTKIRLFTKDSGRWAGENPHDRFTPEAGQNCRHIKGDILHYSYYSIAGHIRQVNKFTDIASQSAVSAGKKSGLFSLLVRPAFKFIRDYFLRAGFLDGYYGFVIATITAHSTFLKYVKMRELLKGK